MRPENLEEGLLGKPPAGGNMGVWGGLSTDGLQNQNQNSFAVFITISLHPYHKSLKESNSEQPEIMFFMGSMSE